MGGPLKYLGQWGRQIVGYNLDANRILLLEHIQKMLGQILFFKKGSAHALTTPVPGKE